MPPLSPPVTAHNLTAWFILAPAAPAADDREYGVLEDSIASQTAVLHETGSVNELVIENTGDLDLFIQAGDIVKGGRQDRSLGADFIVPARSGRIPLPAFCVEQARWHRRKSESVAQFSESSRSLSSKKARLAMHLAKSQHAVWDSIVAEQEALKRALCDEVRSADSPSSLQLTYEHQGVRHAIEDYTAILEATPAAAGGSVVGVAWAIDGVPSHADTYAHPQLFAKLWKKLLHAAATEATCHRHGRSTSATAPTPTTEAMAAWLTATEGPSGQTVHDEQHLPPRTRLQTQRGTTRHRFAAFDTAAAIDAPLHVAVVAG